MEHLPNPIKVLLIDDDEEDYVLTRYIFDEFKDNQFKLEWIDNYTDGLAAIKENRHEIVLLDYRLGEKTGLELLEEAIASGCHAPIILLTGQGDQEIDFRAMQAGAADYLVKSELEAPLLERSIRYSLKHARVLESMQTSETKFRSVIQSASDAIFLVNGKGEVTLWNSAAEQIFGYSEEEIIGQPAVILMGDKYAKRTLEVGVEYTMENVIAPNAGKIIQAAGKRKDGSEFPLELSGSVWKTNNGFFYTGIIRDITERQRASEHLRLSEERYRDLFENANDIIYVHDLQGNFISVNRTGLQVFGYEREEVTKLNIMQVVAPQDLEKAKHQIAAKIAGIATTNYEINCVRKDGRGVVFEVNSRVIFEGDEPVYIQGIARDITERKRSEEALRESEAKFRTVAETASDAILTIDGDGKIIFVNAATEKIFGYRADEMIGENLMLIIPERMHESHRAAMLQYRETKEKTVSWKALELPGRHKSGQEIPLEFSFAEFVREGQRYFTSVIRDVTERKKAEEAVRDSEERFRDLFENANDLIYTHDLQGNFTSLNRAGELITGYTREEALRINFSQVVAPEHIEIAREMMKRQMQGVQTASYELEIISKSGKRVTLEISTRLITKDEKPIGVQGIARDITERKLAEEQLQYNALYDTLTDLPNRAHFMKQLTLAVERAELEKRFRFAVLFLDIDRFKIINDSLGHIIGDKLLVGIAERLKSCVRPSDVIARLGGDEFTILLTIKEELDAVQVAERLQQKLTKPFKLDNYEVFTSASVGIIISDEMRRKPEDYLRDADAAMYRAKEAGKARYEVFDGKMHLHNINLLKVETDLRRAVERGEFVAHYQPIIALDTGEIQEFESLIRWQHPEKGMIPPNDFICIAEETGLIIPIGEWILEESCRQLIEWQKFQLTENLSVSVNLSAKQLMHPSLISQVKGILLKTKLDPQFLKLEVTESMVMEHSETAHTVLSQLRELGVRISTDDFGTGFSSLSYLHRFPFDRLKIDRSFINTMDKDTKSSEIVRTILMLAQNLNIETVAEGIETQPQLLQLKKLGCNFGQGYLFSKPVKAEDAEKLIREGLPPETQNSFIAAEINQESFIEIKNLQ